LAPGLPRSTIETDPFSEVPMMSNRHLLIALLAGSLLASGALPDGVATARAAAIDAQLRLEAGPQTGYSFNANGMITARKSITLVSPASVRVDRRRPVPTRTGAWIRIATGGLAGYEIRESMTAYVPGKIGEAVYSPAATISFTAGRYLGYRFDSNWDLATTKRGTLSVGSSARASRRAVIDGRAYVLMSSGTWAGYWMPVTAHAGRAAQRITCSVPAKVPAGSAAVYRRVSTTDREVALTFDMGGRMTPARDIMERLVVDRVCATIFPTGSAASTAEGKAVLALVKAYPDLFELGNHTQNHCNLRDGGGGAACPSTPPSASRIRSELLNAESILLAQTGRTGAPYWRPPYGAYDARVLSAAAAAGFTRTIMWDIDTIDWRPTADGGPTAGSMAAKVVSNARTGSIVLMHLGGYHTYDALPSMVARLRAANLQPTTISALLRP
jgi:peptidoglycan/xylan/chitin deacetylase (PgdA/CDA1 family)